MNDILIDGITYERFAWTGGDNPSQETRETDPQFKGLRRFYFREQLVECGGLDLWKCAGTSSMERARIFWNRATGDAWATLRAHNRTDEWRG